MGKSKGKLKKYIKDKKAELKKNIKSIKKKSRRSSLSILFDLFWCHIVYGTSQKDYETFFFYDKSVLRDTYLTEYINNKLNIKFNNLDSLNPFTDRQEFNNVFKNYLCRETYNVNDMNYKEFESLVLSKKEFFCKSSTIDSKIKSEKLNINNFRAPGYMLEHIKNNKICLLEDVLYENKKLSKIDPYTVDSIMFETIVVNNAVHVLYAVISFGTKDYPADYIDDDSIFALVDLKTGIIVSDAIDINGKEYGTHPISKEKINGFKVPHFKEAYDMVKELAKEVSDVKRVQWSICITDSKPALLSANTFINYEVVQLAEYARSKKGILPFYKKYIK